MRTNGNDYSNRLLRVTVELVLRSVLAMLCGASRRLVGPMALVGVLAGLLGCGGSAIPKEQPPAAPSTPGSVAGGDAVPGSSPSPPEPTVSVAVPATDGAVTSTSLGPAPEAQASRTNIIEPDPRMVDLRPVRWTSVRPLAGDQRALVVNFATRGEPCEGLGAIELEQSPDTVTVTLLAGRRPNADCSGPRPNIAAPAAAMVMLARPLDGRPVRDGAVP
jgi:hypothetical protein